MKKQIALVQRGGTNSIYNDGRKFWSRSCDSAAIGFETLGYKVVPFDSQVELPSILSKETPVRGSVQTFRRALAHLGITPPPNVDIPEELMGYAGRRIWTSTVGEVVSKGKSVFIKPLDHQKDFSGHVAWYGSSFVFNNLKLPKSYKLLCQEPIKFQGGELRIYVLEGKIIGKRFMPGMPFTQWLNSKELDVVNSMLKAYKSQPSGFCLDVSRIQDTNRLVLIEVNEGFSCGNYGIPHKLYAKMIEARWKELTSQ